MADQTFAFDGLAPWRPEAGLIECEVGTWLLDLHNFAAFLGYTFRADGVLTMTWYHHQPSVGPPTPNLVLLDFTDVRDLRVEQAEDWDQRCADDTHGWDYWPEDGGRAAIAFDVADSDLSFSASGVRLRLVPSDVYRTFG